MSVIAMPINRRISVEVTVKYPRLKPEACKLFPAIGEEGLASDLTSSLLA